MAYKTIELINIAIKLEQDGAAFYGELAQIVKNNKARKFFLQFDEDEKDHEKYFLKLKDEGEVEEEPVEDEELNQIISEIDTQDVLPDKPVKKIEKIHPLNAIRLGIETEKKSIKFYKKLARRLKNPASRRVLEQLINEEKRHARQLTELHKNETFDF